MKIFDFFEEFGLKRLGTVSEGENHYNGKIRDFIESTHSAETLIFDISAMEVFSHSYSKQTIGNLILELSKNGFSRRHFLLKADTFEKLIDTERALEKVNLPMLATVESKSSNFYDGFLVIGPLPNHLREVLNIVIKRKEVTTADISDELKMTLQNASNKLRMLDELKLIIRTADIDRTGNVLSCCRIEV
jgi:hypothetical protein